MWTRQVCAEIMRTIPVASVWGGRALWYVSTTEPKTGSQREIREVLCNCIWQILWWEKTMKKKLNSEKDTTKIRYFKMATMTVSKRRDCCRHLMAFFQPFTRTSQVFCVCLVTPTQSILFEVLFADLQSQVTCLEFSWELWRSVLRVNLFILVHLFY